ncbi:MAG TPA: LysR substrate-binding domain-containing protein [Chthoniobacterales bacterium]|jgi:DNA-binding transcriptional LysR family regulator|nr:LysR substrate-binding domain-containing protein [Chthoniobacterales bacterium]
MKLRHLEYFVAAAEELNFTHAAGRLNVSQPPFSKQIQDLEGELGINLFERERKGVALTAAGKAFLIDARGILEACDQAVKKAQRISRGELGELTVGHMAALTHDFLGQALERWHKESPGIIIDCVDMDAIEQERALLDGRIAVGILVLSDRPILELLSAELLIEHGVSVALPKSHPQAVQSEIRLPILKDQPFIGLNRIYPAYGDWLHTVCQRSGFIPRIVREADGVGSALAFVAAGLGVALVSEPVRKFPAREVVFRDLVAAKPIRIPLGAVWKKNGLESGVVSKFVKTLSRVCTEQLKKQ